MRTTDAEPARKYMYILIDANLSKDVLFWDAVNEEFAKRLFVQDTDDML